MRTLSHLARFMLACVLILLLPGRVNLRARIPTRLIGDPALVYCSTIMGYEYGITTSPDGSQRGTCLFPDGSTCDAWDFYAGRCGSSFSWCARQGLGTLPMSDGRDPYARDYTACSNSQGEILARVSDRIGIGATPGMDDLGLGTTNPVLSAKPMQAPSQAAIPTFFDWRDYLGQDWITPVKDGLACSGGWAFAPVALAEARHNILANDPDLDLDLSEQYLLSDCYTPGSCTTAGYPDDALTYIRDTGIPDEGCFAYYGLDCDCSHLCPDYAGRLKTVPNAHSSASYTGVEIRDLISSYGPVVAEYYMGSGVPGEPSGYFDGDVYRCENDLGGGGSGFQVNHAVLLVGYDYTGGYYVAKNNWGYAWNGDGYFKIGFDECNIEDAVIAWVQGSLPLPYDKNYYFPTVGNPDPGTPPIQNGNFESGPAAWEEFSNADEDLIIDTGFPSPITPHGGSWAVWLRGNVNSDNYIQQPVTVPASSPYLQFQQWVLSDEPLCIYDDATIAVNGVIRYRKHLCADEGDWSVGRLDLGAYAGQTIMLQFRVQSGNDGYSSQWFIDDVNFTFIGNLPLPSPGDALSLLVWDGFGY